MIETHYDFLLLKNKSGSAFGTSTASSCDDDSQEISLVAGAAAK
ncbi:hypothetical protein RCG24_00325 [Neobacillus sp. OS1-32]|nr:hypothetical protein [Neobacillus sp. OS1-32]WML30401.1 hypothetical protein RCG24_00325 [Neobacillus sp. OS1-32]